MGGEIQVSLEVRAVDDIQYNVGLFVDEVVSCHHFFQRVRGKRVDTGQVDDGDAFVLFQFAFLLFHGNPGPVSDELIRARKGVEQRGLAAVGIARESNSNIHICLHFILLQFRYSSSTRIFSASALRSESS